MSDKKNKPGKTPKKPPEKNPQPFTRPDDDFDDGDFATPKRDYNEDEIKEEEDRLG